MTAKSKRSLTTPSKIFVTDSNMLFNIFGYINFTF